jgi:hypothetical protein
LLYRLPGSRRTRRFLGNSYAAFTVVITLAAAMSVMTGPVTGGLTIAALRQQRFAPIIPAKLLGLVFINRAGMRYFLSDLEFVELVDDLARLHFQLPRQFIDSNLTHIKVFRLTACPSHYP